MSDWIEINIPFYSQKYKQVIEYPPFPNLSAEAREKFGRTYTEWNQEFNDEERKYLLDMEDLEDFLKNDNVENKDLQKRYIEYRNFVKSYNQWYNQHPNVIERNKLSDEIHASIIDNSFEGLGLNKPGTLIEIDNVGKIDQHLIGDINENAMVGNEYKEFDEDAIVKRYKIIYSKK